MKYSKSRFKLNRPKDSRSDLEKVTDYVAYGLKIAEKKLQKEDLRECMRAELEELLVKLKRYARAAKRGKEPWKDLPEIQMTNLTRMLRLKGE